MIELLEVVDFLIDGARRLIADPFDRRRIRQFFDARGSSVSSIEWSPVAAGWMSHWHDRFYVVKSADAAGNRQVATCRTNGRQVVVVNHKELHELS